MVELRRSAEAVVIGAGPAGLSAGLALSRAGVDVVVIDRGHEIAMRRHDVVEDLGEGVGGAGLFSDGKFSFYPSGTQLYALPSRDRLRASYDWCCQMLGRVGIDSIPFPEVLDMFGYCGQAIKGYPSFYGSLAERRDLIVQLAAELDGCLVPHTSLRSLRAGRDCYHLDLERRGEACSIEARSVIFATGRLGPLAAVLHESELVPMSPLRFEVGVRLESLHHQTFLARECAADVKRLQRIEGVEFRTFCTCRRGEVWNLRYGPYAALSGRSDGPPTEYSNFGFLARFTDDRLADGAAAWRVVEPLIRNAPARYQPLGDFLGERWPTDVRVDRRPWYPQHSFLKDDIREFLGPKLGAIMQAGLRELLEWSPELRNPSTVCLFPAIEGVGDYPMVDAELRIPGQRIWCAGDLVGTMRGLVPSLVNGYYVGLDAASA